MSEHTPTPWYYQAEIEIDGDLRRTRHHIYRKSGTFGHPAECGSQADAEFIVRACNAYDDAHLRLVKEVAHWKALYEDEKRNHEATIKHAERGRDEEDRFRSPS